MRYARQTILPELGLEGQANLARARLLCIGAGGLGSAALPYLAAAGVGTIGVCDDDKIELSNLQRQVLFKTSEVGQSKAVCAAQSLKALNPEITVEAHTEKLSAENALSLFATYDIIIDGTDNFAAKFLINDTAVKLGKPWIYAAVLGFEAQVATFIPGGACYRCLYETPPATPVANCAEAGVLGAFVGVAGSMQAVEALKLAAKRKELSPLGRVISIDSRDWQWREFALKRNPSCPVCSKQPSDVRLTMSNNACSTAPVPVPAISSQEAAQLKNALFVDVREPSEWDEGHVPGAVHIPVGALLTQDAPDLPRDKEMVIYCRSGGRSSRALAYLMKLGFTNGKNLTGGFTTWEKEIPARVERASGK